MNICAPFKFLLAISLLFLIACGSKDSQPLRIGANNWLGYAPLHLAKELGYFDGSDVKVVQLSSASEIIHAFRMGNLEAAALTLDEALTVIQDGFDVTIVYVFDISNGADVVMAKPEFDSIAKLKGKMIAVESTAVGAITLDAALRSGMLTPRDVELVNCEFDRHVECYDSAAAIVTFEPVKSLLLRKNANILFDSSQIPDTIFDVLVISNQYLVNNEDGVQALVNGIVNAKARIEENPKDAFSILSPITGLSVKESLVAVDGLIFPSQDKLIRMLDPESDSLKTVSDRVAKLLYERNLLDEMVTVGKLGQNKFIINSK